MKNYTDRFTPEQLETLRRNFVVGPGEVTAVKAYDWDDELPAEPTFTEELYYKFVELFKEYCTEHPDEYNPTGNMDPQILEILAFEDFFTDALLEMFKNEAEETEAPEDNQITVYKPNTALFLITHPKYQGAFLPQKNDTAYIIDIDNQLHLAWDKDGNPVIHTVSEEKEIEELLNREKIPADCADTELLETFASAVANSYICNVKDRITVKYTSFFKAIGTKQGTEGNNRADPMERIKRLENIGGVLVEQKKIQRVFVWIEMDTEAKTLTFESPYLYSIMDLLKQDPVYRKKRNNIERRIYGVSYLVKSEATSAKDKITIQIAKYLVINLHQHGKETEAKHNPGKQYKDKRMVKCAISYAEIIENCPRLREAIEKTPSRSKQILNRAIFGPKYETNKRSRSYHPTTKLEEYIKKYTIAFEYFKDLEIEVEPVSLRKLDNEVIFTHHGYNGDVKKLLHLPSYKGALFPVTFEDMDAEKTAEDPDN